MQVTHATKCHSKIKGQHRAVQLNETGQAYIDMQWQSGSKWNIQNAQVKCTVKYKATTTDAVKHLCKYMYSMSKQDAYMTINQNWTNDLGYNFKISGQRHWRPANEASPKQIYNAPSIEPEDRSQITIKPKLSISSSCQSQFWTSRNQTNKSNSKPWSSRNESKPWEASNKNIRIWKGQKSSQHQSEIERPIKYQLTNSSKKYTTQI